MTRAYYVAAGLGAVSALLILGALGFQYLGGYPPCEMCQWQRWPHFAAVAAGLGGAGLFRAGWMDRRGVTAAALLAVLLVAASGALGVFHAGVEWHWWKGPQACTGSLAVFTGTLDLNAKVVMCDIAAWRLFGISMAGYNAILSLGAAAIGAIALWRKPA